MSSIKAIAAVSQNGVIGVNGDLPWRIPGELKWFKKITMGSIIVMGRKTWESLPGPLPGRENWVLSKSLLENTNIKVFSSFQKVLHAANGRTVFIIGGGQIYAELISNCDELYITEVHQTIENGDVFFPEYKDKFTCIETLEKNNDFTIRKWKKSIKPNNKAAT